MNESLFMLMMLIILITDVMMNFCVAMYARKLTVRFGLCLTELERIAKSLDVDLKKILESMANQMLLGVKQMFKGYYGKAKANLEKSVEEGKGFMGQVKEIMKGVKEFKDEFNEY